MSNKKNSIGKLLAFATTVATIGGICYIFRDKIKENPIFQSSVDKVSKTFSKFTEDKKILEEDDFFFDDEDDDFDKIFSDNEKQNREYTSISINQKEEQEVAPITSNNFSKVDDTSEETSTSFEKESIEEFTSSFETESISNASVSNQYDTQNDFNEDNDIYKKEENYDIKDDTMTTASNKDFDYDNDSIPTISLSNISEKESIQSKNEPIILGYEYEGLSDVSEDPDVLEETDKLDF